ncbi:MAG: hypothetical protein ABH817_01255 [archaeon]
MGALTIPYILTLAAADAVNPCALAVLVLVLVAILTQYPRDRKKVLQAGFAFSITVLITYFIYGLLIIGIFKGLGSLEVVRPFIYKGLGVIAILFGLLNIKDAIRYGAGGFLMEVPSKWRPKMKSLISSVTSVKGAIVIAILVSVFLLPCTIGPYFIAGGLLAKLGLLAIVPWLLMYNVVFVLPMIAITLVVYLGFTTVSNVSGWREKNVRILHLIAGLILFFIGLAMLLGWGL